MADKQSNTNEELDDIVENADGTVTVNPGKRPADDGNEDGNETGANTGADEHDDDDDDPASDERLTSSGEATGNEEGHEETLQERRRRERRDRKERQKAREESLVRENRMLADQLRQTNERVNLIERKGQGTELAQIDAAITEAARAETYFKQMVSDGVTAGNGEVVADATDKMFQARVRKDQLTLMRNAASKQTTQQRPALQPPRELVNRANTWMTKNAWYDPQSGDEDSAVLAALDNRLGAEGRFDPSTAQYWEELDKRAARVLPHRYRQGKVGANVQKPARTPATGSGRETASSSGGGTEFTLSAPRVQALKDAGMWNDKTVRAAAIKDFQAYDRKQADEKRSNGGSK